MNGTPFTDEEIAYLRNSWGKLPNAEVYRQLRLHSRGSIERKASYLGLKRKTRRTTKLSRIKVIQELWRIREERSISRKVLARIAGYHTGMIQRYEKGDAVPSLLKLIDWCDALGCELTVVQKREPVFDDARPDYEEEIHRICLTCRTNFMTTSRFIRRCEKCRHLEDI